MFYVSLIIFTYVQAVGEGQGEGLILFPNQAPRQEVIEEEVVVERILKYLLIEGYKCEPPDSIFSMYLRPP